MPPGSVATRCPPPPWMRIGSKQAGATCLEDGEGGHVVEELADPEAVGDDADAGEMVHHVRLVRQRRRQAHRKVMHKVSCREDQATRVCFWVFVCVWNGSIWNAAPNDTQLCHRTQHRSQGVEVGGCVVAPRRGQLNHRITCTINENRREVNVPYLFVCPRQKGNTPPFLGIISHQS